MTFGILRLLYRSVSSNMKVCILAMFQTIKGCTYFWHSH